VLNIIAAVGWVRLVSCLLKSANQEAGRVRRLEPLAYPLIAAGLLVYTFWYQPYHLAHYNPLAGGGAVAQRAIYVGWGEGLAQAARYINAQPGPYGCGYPMAVDYNWVMEHYACAPVRHISQVNLTGNVAYSVLYINQVQRNLYTETSHLLQTHGSLVHTVRLHGIDYARIYQLPLPVEHTITADFGSSIRLVGYSLDSSALRSTGVLTLTVQWQARQPVEEDVMLFVHVLDEQGRRVAQVDVPLAGPQMPTHMWQAGHYYQWAHPLPVGAEQAAGTSWLAAGLYHPDTAERLPLQAPAPSGRLDYGSDALVLPPVTLLP
jgi:hypothetical protein